MEVVGSYDAKIAEVSSTVSQRLEREKKELEYRLTQINEALDALNKNPEIKDVINKISQITHFR